MALNIDESDEESEGDDDDEEEEDDGLDIYEDDGPEEVDEIDEVFKVPLRSNCRYPFFYIFVHNKSS